MRSVAWRSRAGGKEVWFYLLAMVCRFHLVIKEEQREDESVALLGLKILKL